MITCPACGHQNPPGPLCTQCGAILPAMPGEKKTMQLGSAPNMTASSPFKKPNLSPAPPGAPAGAPVSAHDLDMAETLVPNSEIASAASAAALGSQPPGPLPSAMTPSAPSTGIPMPGAPGGLPGIPGMPVVPSSPGAPLDPKDFSSPALGAPAANAPGIGGPPGASASAPGASTANSSPPPGPPLGSPSGPPPGPPSGPPPAKKKGGSGLMIVLVLFAIFALGGGAALAYWGYTTYVADGSGNSGDESNGEQTSAENDTSTDEDTANLTACDRAQRCCEAYVEALNSMTPGSANVEQACAAISTAAGTPGADATCDAQIPAFRTSLETMQRPVPSVCEGGGNAALEQAMANAQGRVEDAQNGANAVIEQANTAIEDGVNPNGANEQAPGEQPQVEQAAGEQPVAEQPEAEQPVAEQPVAEQPVAEQPVAEQPVAEQPAAEQPVDAPRDPAPRNRNGIPGRYAGGSVEARIRRQVQRAAGRCFTSNGAHGSVTVQVAVGYDGRVTTSRVVNNGTGNNSVARCISGALVGSRIAGSLPRGGVNVNIEFSR